MGWGKIRFELCVGNTVIGVDRCYQKDGDPFLPSISVSKR